MKKAVLLIFALSLTFDLQAQTHKVKIIRDDRIVTKNGKTTAECSQPLNNVRIYFPYTPATVSTDGNGLASVPKDGKKNSYEIKQIRCQDYFLPDSLNIYNKPYAYETGKVNTIRMVSKQRYEESIKKRTARLEKQIQEFRKRQQQDNTKFQQYEDSIAALNKMLDNIPRDILEILTTDFSNYTEEELKMQQLFDEGDYDAITANADKVNRQIDLVETAQSKIDSAKRSLFVTLPIMAKSFANKLNLDSATYYYTKAADMFDTNFQAQIEAGSFLQAFACNYDLALKYYNRALHIAEKNNDSIDIAISYNYIGMVYYAKSNYDKALEYYNKALTIQKAKLGEQHTDVARSYNNIGSVYQANNDYDKALEFFNKALAIQKAKLGEQHTDVALSYNNIGSVYQANNDYDKALDFYNKALAIQKAKLGEEHTDVATSYNNIGWVYYYKEDYDKALEFFNKALAIQKAKLGEQHTDVATSYNSIGLVYYYKEDYDKALEYYDKALSIFLSKGNEADKMIFLLYKLKVLCYSALGDTDKAEEYLKKAAEIEQRLK